MSEDIIQVSANPKDLLTKEEARAYRIYMAKKDPPLAPQIQAQLFNLYLNGASCEEIQRLNPNLSLGMIVRARVEGLWDDQRQRYLDSLFSAVRERVQQVQMESVMLTADMLAAANKMFGDKLKKYIQTDDPRELGELRIDSLKQYRDAVELLMKLTGQDKKVEVTGTTKTVVEFKNKLTPIEAAAILKAADKED